MPLFDLDGLKCQCSCIVVRVCVALIVSLCAVGPLSAQEPTTEIPSGHVMSGATLPTVDGAWTPDNAGQVFESKLAGAKDTVQSLIHGDLSTVTPLLSAYLVPAAIALVLILAGYMVAGFAGRCVGTMVSNKVDITLGRFLGKFVSNGIILLLVVSILRRFGIETAHFAAVIAAMGFAIGMALQGSLSHFAAGVMLLVFRPFKVGDVVKVSDCEGTVDEIELFTTRINTFDNRHMILPNGQVFGSVILNYTHNPVRRVDVNVGVAYNADIRQTRGVLESAVSVIPGAVSEPPPRIVLTELGDSAVCWQVRLWTRPENFVDVRERVITAVKEALDASHIAIPFPQMDIHINGQAQEQRLNAAA